MSLISNGGTSLLIWVSWAQTEAEGRRTDTQVKFERRRGGSGVIDGK